MASLMTRGIESWVRVKMTTAPKATASRARYGQRYFRKRWMMRPSKAAPKMRSSISSLRPPSGPPGRPPGVLAGTAREWGMMAIARVPSQILSGARWGAGIPGSLLNSA